MAWVAIVVLGLIAEVSLIISLGRRAIRRDEGGSTAPRDLLGPRYGTIPREDGGTVPRGDGGARPAVPSPRPPADGARAPTPRPRRH